MNKYKVVAMVVVSSLFVAVGFQNCSKVGVSDLNGIESSKVISDGHELPPVDDSGTGMIQVPGDQVADPLGEGEIMQGRPTPKPPVAEMPPAGEPEQEQEEPAKTPTIEQPAPPKTPTQAGPTEPTVPTVPTEEPKTPSTPTAGTPPKETCEAGDEECESESEAVAMCLKSNKAVKASTVTGSKVGSAKEPLIVKANTLEVVGTRGNGNLVVIAEGANARISVTDFHGKLTICGMSGGDVIGGAGKVVVIQSKLDGVIGHSKGNVFVDSSSEIADVTGSKIKGLK